MNNFSDKIKKFAVISAVCEIIVFLYIAIRLFMVASDLSALGSVGELYVWIIIILAVGVISALTTGFTLYALGEIVAKTGNIARSNDEIARNIKTSGLGRSAAPAPAEPITVQRIGQ